MWFSLITLLLGFADQGLLSRTETRVQYLVPIGITGYEQRENSGVAWTSAALTEDGRPPQNWKNRLRTAVIGRLAAEAGASVDESTLQIRSGLSSDRCWMIALTTFPHPLGDSAGLPDEKVNLAILPFRILDPDLPPGTDQNASLVMISMINAPNVTLVERSEVARIVEARQFTELNLTEEDDGIAVGRLLNTRFLLMGTVGRSEAGDWIVTGRLLDIHSGQISDDHRAAVVLPAESGSLVRALQDLAVAMGLRNKPGQPARPLRLSAAAPVGTVDAALRTIPPPQTGRLVMTLEPNRAIYEEGESIRLRITSDRAGYLTILTVGANGDILSLVPNQQLPSLVVQAGETLVIPAPEMGFRFTVQPPFGAARIRAFLTEHPLIVPGRFDDRRAQVLTLVRDESLGDSQNPPNPDSSWLTSERTLLTRPVPLGRQ